MINEFKAQRILAGHAHQHIEKNITLHGWLHDKQLIDNNTIIELRDRSGLISILITDFADAKKINQICLGSILQVKGIVQKTPLGKIQLQSSSVIIDICVNEESPIELNKPIEHSAENLTQILENRIVNLRNPQEQTIFRINTAIEYGIRNFLIKNDFFEFHSPKILACASEGGTEIFKFDYFGREATLAQSAQFYKQIMAQGFERVFEIGSTFRAEPSISTRHMTDFMTLDVEMAFINDLSDIMGLLYSMLKDVSESIWQIYKNELEYQGASKPIFNDKFPVLTLEQLHNLCLKETGQDFRNEKDPTPFEEDWICKYSAQHWGSDAVFICEFPVSTMKFYQYRNQQNPKVIDRFDLIFKGVEISTGGRRENRYEKLLEQMKELGINSTDYEYSYYLQVFKYGAPAHGGFGLGLARLTQLLIGLKSVKEAVLFVRDKDRLLP